VLDHLPYYTFGFVIRICATFSFGRHLLRVVLLEKYG
jgi:hypothetical protein